jgi:ABC-type antimicrobial peptide transport system permease subunit
VLDRIGGLALLRAVGFTPWRIRRLLVSETIVAVGLGLAAGTLAGCLAVAPALAAATARVPLGWIAATCGLTLATAVVAAGLAATRAPIPERPGAGA